MSVLKFFHVLFVFIWIGSLLALTRLLGYHGKQEEKTQLSLGKIYRRMYLLVDLPSMCLAVIFGVILLCCKNVDFKAPWFHLKMTCAALLIICDIVTGCQASKLAKKTISGRGVGFKILHGVTALFLIGVLIAIYIMK